MLVDGYPAFDGWGQELQLEPLDCEDCGRSIVTRFGEPIGPQFCPSCEADWDRIPSCDADWDRIRQQSGGALEVVEESDVDE